MKIELTNAEIKELCNAHDWFMDKIIAMTNTDESVNESVPPTFEKLFPYEISQIKALGNSNKIAAIKWLREYTRGNNALCEKFRDNGYECGYYSYNSEIMMLTLKGAKDFVEKVLATKPVNY